MKVSSIIIWVVIIGLLAITAYRIPAAINIESDAYNKRMSYYQVEEEKTNLQNQAYNHANSHKR